MPRRKHLEEPKLVTRGRALDSVSMRRGWGSLHRGYSVIPENPKEPPGSPRRFFEGRNPKTDVPKGASPSGRSQERGFTSFIVFLLSGSLCVLVTIVSFFNLALAPLDPFFFLVTGGLGTFFAILFLYLASKKLSEKSYI